MDFFHFAPGGAGRQQVLAVDQALVDRPDLADEFIGDGGVIQTGKAQGHEAAGDGSAYRAHLHPAAKIGGGPQSGILVVACVLGEHRYHRLGAVVNRPAVLADVGAALHGQIRVFAHCCFLRCHIALARSVHSMPTVNTISPPAGSV